MSQSGELIQRGALNKAKTNQYYLDDVAEKFKATKSEYDQESTLKTLQPRNHVKREAIKEFINEKIKYLRDKGRWEEAAAWQHWLADIQIKSFDNAIDAAFTLDFQKWLFGSGTEADHQKT